MIIPDEKFQMCKDKAGNCIAQIVEVRTCQCVLTLMDKRTNEMLDWSVIYVVPFDTDWKTEVTRICLGLGYEVCGFGEHWIRSGYIDSLTQHGGATPIQEPWLGA